MLRRKCKMQFVKQERNTQNAIALFNYLKCIVPQQLRNAWNTSFQKKNFKALKMHT
jgi:hypothetical protein